MNKKILTLKIIVGIVLTLKLLECAIPTGHGDALYYHLVLGKVWLESGLDFAYRNVCGAITTGIMDHLYVIPQFFLGSFIGAHVVAQYMHFLMSVGFCCLICFLYFKDDKKIALLGALAFLTLNHSPDMLIYPKNDGFMGATALFTSIFIFDKNWLIKSDDVKRPLIIGLLLGLLTITKINSLTIVFPLSLYYVYSSKNNLKNIFIVAIISLSLFSVILFRNYYYMGSPLFPAFARLFPGKMSPEMVEIFTVFMSNPIKTQTAWLSIKAFFTAKTALLAIPIIVLFKKANFKDVLIQKLMFLSITVFVLYMLTNGGIYSPRFIFPVLFINIFVGLLFLRNFDLNKNKIFVVLLILIFADSKIDKIILRVKGLGSYYPITNSQEQMNRISEKSIFFNTFRNQEGVRIITDDFNESYYAPARTTLHSIECQPEANFLFNCNEENINKLYDYDYAIFKFNKNNLCYQKFENIEPIHKTEVYRLYKIEK